MLFDPAALGATHVLENNGRAKQTSKLQQKGSCRLATMTAHLSGTAATLWRWHDVDQAAAAKSERVQQVAENGGDVVVTGHVGHGAGEVASGEGRAVGAEDGGEVAVAVPGGGTAVGAED